MDNSILIKDEELQQLDKLIGDMPTKYGLPIIQFVNLVRQKRNAEAQQAQLEVKYADGTKAPIEITEVAN